MHGLCPLRHSGSMCTGSGVENMRVLHKVRGNLYYEKAMHGFPKCIKIVFFNSIFCELCEVALLSCFHDLCSSYLIFVWTKSTDAVLFKHRLSHLYSC